MRTRKFFSTKLRARLLAGALCALVLGFPAPQAGGRVRQDEGPGSTRPNILVIVTDDQRAGTLDAMPATRRAFTTRGRTYTDAYATSPLCCPSRASIMTGRYPHNHGVERNEDAEKLDQETTLQYYLKQAGYTTGMVGKYLNSWDEASAAPPYFDRWAAIDDGSYSHVYYDFLANVNGKVFFPGGYSTDFIATKTVKFLRDFEEHDETPWFMYVAPFAPHKPFHPEPIYRGASTPLWNGNPAVEEADRDDKPSWVQRRHVLLSGARTVSRKQYRTLMSVDDMVSRIFQTLRKLDEARPTLAFFLSDNGYLWGEHGLASKRFPYTAAVKVPFVVRWPGQVSPGSVDGRMFANIDIVPTVLDVLDIEADPDAPVDGRSVFAAGERDGLLFEYNGARLGESPPWASYRSKTYQYIEYYDETTGALEFREYYDLANDRYQLENLFGDDDPFNDPLAPPLMTQLADAKSCRGDSCP